ncbi:MAG: hypothetical protein FJY88_14235 [Candidatus Eisenbacteria bacterium]|nr:hypothetical protein [Candidatus Eisenbacteria bacterium]
MRARPDDPYGSSRAQLGEIGVIDAHDAGYAGARVLVMMLDTGFRKDHDAFAETDLLAERDFVFSDDETQNEPEDSPYQHWHGTATWSACGGRAPGTLTGPAYRSTFLLAKTEDVRSETPVEEDNYIAALEWGDSLGVMVTSASLIYLTFDGGGGWGYPDLDGDTVPLTRALDRAAQRGILCVNAMGNYGAGVGTLGVPADADSILACGAVDASNQIASFSSRGPTHDGRIKPEVVARGVDTFAADADGPDLYRYVSGTSLSTPLVGGACALVLEAHPEWSAEQARDVLMQTADRSSAPDNNYGHGRIDVWAAIESSPRVVPVPFDLLEPADEETLADHRPTFRWRASTDPGGGGIDYELWIDDQGDFSSPLVYPDLQDTLLAIPDPLAPQQKHYWRVIAEEPDGYRRLSRSDGSFTTPEGSDAQDPALGADRWILEARPNPWSAETLLRWFAPAAGMGQVVRLTLLDPAGRRLMRERLPVTHVGWNEFPLQSRSLGGTSLTSGVYIVLLEAPGTTVKMKVVLAR